MNENSNEFKINNRYQNKTHNEQTNDKFTIDDDTEQIQQKPANQINIVFQHFQIEPCIIISP